jgi:hypothetical protein
MRINPQEKRPIDTVLLPVQANRLRDGQNVPLIEGPFEG